MKQYRSLCPVQTQGNPWPCPGGRGNTALCSVGRSFGNDLHYLGYDLLDLQRNESSKRWSHSADRPRRAAHRGRNRRYKKELQSARSLPGGVRTVLERVPATAIPMDVLARSLRAGESARRGKVMTPPASATH